MVEKINNMEDIIEKPICIDLGCGQNKATPEYFIQNNLVTEIPDKVIGVDFVKTESCDVQHNLTIFPYPFEDESVDAIHCSHFLEHLDGFERMKFFNECYRILKPKGKIKLVHPYYKSSRAQQDPTHKAPFLCEASYLYWDKNWREINKLDHYPINCDYNFWIAYTFMDNVWLNKSEEARNFAIKHYFDVVADMIVEMQKK